MDANTLLTSPLVWFALMVLAGYALYLWGSRVAPRPAPSAGKLAPYVGGEDVPLQTTTPDYRFYQVALFFTIMHVAALLVATAPPDRIAWGALLYLSVVSFSLVLLRWQ
jgi:NADH:ubiquinone oxidoreductase subunit 3 (subunit A)